MSALSSPLFLEKNDSRDLPLKAITVYLFDIEGVTPLMTEHPKYAKKYTLSIRNLSVHHTPLFERTLILVSKQERHSLPDFYKRTGWTKILKAHYLLFRSEDLPDEFSAEEKASKRQDLEKSLRILSEAHPALSNQKPTCFSSLTSFYYQWTTPAEEIKIRQEVTALSLSFLGYLYDCGIGMNASHENAILAHIESIKRNLPLSKLFQANHFAHNHLINLAIILYKEAAKAGYITAQNRLGYIFSTHEISNPESAQQAFKWNKLASDQGDRIGQNNLAYLYQTGLGVERDIKKAKKLYRLSAKQGYTTAQCNLAHIYFSENNKEKTFKYYQMAAESRSIEGNINLGYCYQYGVGTKIDMAKAVSFYEIGVQFHDEKCINNLAFCYQHGKGVDQNYNEAIRLYNQAISLGFTTSYYNYAHMFLYGTGVPKNPQQAFDYFKIAADQGYSPAQYMVATLYYHGKEIPQNLTEAIRYFKMHYQHTELESSERSEPINFKNLRYSRKNFLNSSVHIPKEKLSLYLQAHLYLVKGPFLPFAKYTNNQNMDIQRIKEIYDLLYRDMDRAWDLLPESTLRNFVCQLSRLIERIVHFNPNNIAFTEEEIAESYLKDIKLSAKKTLRHRQASFKKKAKPSSEVQIITIKETDRQQIAPSPQPAAMASQVPQKIKPKSEIKQKAQNLKDQRLESFETYKTNIQKVLADLKKRENEMKLFYLKNCDGHIRKLMQALFDKVDMTVPEVNKLIEHLAEIYDGDARQGTRTGGMLILKIGDLTTGGHAPHGGKTTVDRGALADLRQLLASHYMTHLCSETQ